MRRENGVTLISLIMYIILMLFVLAIVTRITSALYFNLNEIDKESEWAISISKFNMYFLNDIKNKNTTVSNYSSNSITLHNTDNAGDITYSMQGETLFRNKVKICDNVNDIYITNTGKTIKVYLNIGAYSRTITYVIE